MSSVLMPGQARPADKAPARDGIRPGRAGELPTVPAHVLPHRSPRELLALARRGLAEAAETRPDGQRHATAHLAALRAAAAVLVARARPTPSRRGRPTSVWALLAMVAPEMAEWAALFAAGAAKRSAAEAGILRVVTTRQADDLCHDAERFVAAVEISLGLPHQTLLTARAG
ncbi:MAG: SAV_6107 family HEPN domain-containing protein [Actinocatenispora sp.]